MFHDDVSKTAVRHVWSVGHAPLLVREELAYELSVQQRVSLPHRFFAEVLVAST